MHVLVNASNVTAMGTRSLVRNLLPPFIHSSSEHTVTLILPDEEEFHSLPKHQNVNVIYWRIIRGLWNNATRLKYLLWDLPRLTRRIRPDICLTLGDFIEQAEKTDRPAASRMKLKIIKTVFFITFFVITNH